MFTLVELQFCKVLMVEAWNAPAGRYFIAYRALDNFRYVIGLPVIDEFATFSSPIFFCSNLLIGKIYNAGITLGHKRDPEMGIDLGWPPLVIGYDAPAPELTNNWENELLEAIQKTVIPRGAELAGNQSRTDEYQVKKLQIGSTEIFATDAPLLPKQLHRVAQKSKAPFCVAFSTANHLTAQEDASPVTVNVASESVLARITDLLTRSSEISR